MSFFFGVLDKVNGFHSSEKTTKNEMLAYVKNLTFNSPHSSSLVQFCMLLLSSCYVLSALIGPRETS